MSNFCESIVSVDVVNSITQSNSRDLLDLLTPILEKYADRLVLDMINDLSENIDYDAAFPI